MQDPRKDIRHVLKGLVCRPTLQQQADTIRQYFTPDVKFYHYIVNLDRGCKDLIAIYQIGELTFRYQTVQFHDIIWDELVNASAINITVFVRPLLALFQERKLIFFTLLELEDHTTTDGRTLKFIKVQRDYFDRSPILSALPIFSTFYNSVWLRILMGRMIVFVVGSLRNTYRLFYPEHM